MVQKVKEHALMEINTEKKFINRMIRYSILLVIWSAFSAVLFGTLLPSIVLIFLGIFLLIVILSLINLSPLITWMILLLGGGVIIYLNNQIWGLTQVFYLNSGLTILTFLGGRYYSVKVCNAKQALEQKLASNQDLVESSIVYDPTTNLMRRRFAEKALTIEVARSHRLATSLSLMMIRVPHEKAFPDGKVYDPTPLFAELFRGNLRENIDIAFIDEDFGAILPEMDRKTAQFAAWQMVQDMQNVLGIEIKIGIASVSADINAVDVLMAAAKSALTTAVEIDQPIVTHLFMTKTSKTELKFSGLLKDLPEKALMHYLQNPSLGDHEWIVWLEGVRDIEQIKWVKDRFQSSASVQVLGLWDRFLVVKLAIGQIDATEFGAAFAGWKIHDTDIDKRFAWIVSEHSQ